MQQNRKSQCPLLSAHDFTRQAFQLSCVICTYLSSLLMKLSCGLLYLDFELSSESSIQSMVNRPAFRFSTVVLTLWQSLTLKLYLVSSLDPSWFCLRALMKITLNQSHSSNGSVVDNSKTKSERDCCACAILFAVLYRSDNAANANTLRSAI